MENKKTQQNLQDQEAIVRIFTDNKKIEVRYDSLPNLIIHFDELEQESIKAEKKDEFRRYGVTTQDDFDNYIFCIDHGLDPRIAQFVLEEIRWDMCNRCCETDGNFDGDDLSIKMIDKDGKVFCAVETQSDVHEVPFENDVYEDYLAEYGSCDLDREGHVFDRYTCRTFDLGYTAYFFLAIVNENGTRRIVTVPITSLQKYEVGSGIIFRQNGKYRQGLIEKYWETNTDFYPRDCEFDGEIVDIQKEKILILPDCCNEVLDDWSEESVFNEIKRCATSGKKTSAEISKRYFYISDCPLKALATRLNAPSENAKFDVNFATKCIENREYLVVCVNSERAHFGFRFDRLLEIVRQYGFDGIAVTDQRLNDVVYYDNDSIAKTYVRYNELGSKKRLKNCIEKLNSDEINYLGEYYYSILVEYYQKGISLKDIAKKDEMSEKNVKEYMRQARSVLKEIVERW